MARLVSDSDAINYLYGGDDVEILYHAVKRIRVRYKQKCCSIYHKRKLGTIPPGAEAVRETAKIEGRFRTAYTCPSCIDRAKVELREQSNG